LRLCLPARDTQGFDGFGGHLLIPASFLMIFILFSLPFCAVVIAIG
jgi:hypothetical protein